MLEAQTAAEKAEAAAFEQQLRNPPAELVMRDHSGAVVATFRVPRIARQRRRR